MHRRVSPSSLLPGGLIEQRGGMAEPLGKGVYPTTNHDVARNAALSAINDLFKRNNKVGGFLHAVWADSFAKDKPSVITSRLYVDARVVFIGKRELYRVKENLVAALNEPEREV